MQQSHVKNNTKSCSMYIHCSTFTTENKANTQSSNGLIPRLSHPQFHCLQYWYLLQVMKAGDVSVLQAWGVTA